MPRYPLLFVLILLGSCVNHPKGNIKSNHPLQQKVVLHLPEINPEFQTFPLYIDRLSFSNSPANKDSITEISARINQELLSFYFKDQYGDSLETNFTVKDSYIGTIALPGRDYNLFVLLLHRSVGSTVESRVLFFDNRSKLFLKEAYPLQLHAKYDWVDGKLTISNLANAVDLAAPDIDTLTFNGAPAYKFSTLYHNGTANAIQTIIIGINRGTIDTLSASMKWLH